MAAVFRTTLFYTLCANMPVFNLQMGGDMEQQIPTISVPMQGDYSHAE